MQLTMITKKYDIKIPVYFDLYIFDEEKVTMAKFTNVNPTIA